MERKSEIKANCSNCVYVSYLESDGVRFERCKIRRKYNQFKTNPLALESVENGCESLCEKYQPAQELKMVIVYR